MHWKPARLAFALVLFPCLALADASRSIIVMDGSGSMWGQIEGRTKLEIARETVTEVLGTIPPSQEIGLMAYGHREKGNCSDIELMVSPAAGTGAEIAARVNQMRFLGKTPLSESVRQAAQALRFGEEAATVVLVTDGLETCAADPCAVARELEAAGLDFTAHVIGFGLTEAEGAQVACLATETGGQYFQASDAGALAEALAQTVPQTLAAEPEPEPEAKASGPHFPGAPRMENVALQPTGATIGTLQGDPAAPAFAPDGTAELCAAACEGDALCTAFRYEPPGSLFVAEPRCFLYPASSEMDWAAMTPGEGWMSGVKDGVLMLVRPWKAPETARLIAPASAPQGARIMVSYEGPRSLYDYLRVIDASGTWLAEAAVGEANPLELQLPWALGDFTLAYVLEGDVIGQTQSLTLTPAPVSITAPAKAQVGSTVTISWEGPRASLDNIQLWQVGGDRIEYQYLDDTNQLTFTLPETPGDHEFRYVFGDAQVIHTTPITLVPEAVEPEPEPIAAPPETVPPETAPVIAPEPAGQEAAPDRDPLPVTITGPYMGTLRQWAAIPLPDGPALQSAGEINGPWDISLPPGDWLITARAFGAEGEGLASVVEVTAAGAIEIGQPTFSTTPISDQPPFHRECQGSAPCSFEDSFSGLRALLLPGWLLQDPYPMTTAAGESSGLPSTLFGTRGTGDRPLAALNPRQWDASLGPCETNAAGTLCRLADLPAEAQAGYRVLAASLRHKAQPIGLVGKPVTLDPDAAATLRNRLLGQN